jgi:hypothetical protein
MAYKDGYMRGVRRAMSGWNTSQHCASKESEDLGFKMETWCFPNQQPVAFCKEKHSTI